MFGVVLWSDEIKKRAVVWCDDHGDLAFYRRDTRARDSSMPFAAGDLIQFDLKEAAAMRIVSKPRVVERESYPTLTEDLRQAGAAMGALTETCQSPGGARERTADVIPLNARRCVEVA